MGHLDTAFRALDAYVKRKLEFGSIPGMSVGITSPERLLGCRYYGFSDIESRVKPTKDTLFEIGSISKSFASVVAMQLVDEGRLDLRLPVDEYLPWLGARWKGERFTMHHLMSHTAGLPTGSEATPEATSEVWAVRDMELGCPPGQFFHYSNIGYKIVGLVIEALTGTSCASAITARVLEPLGMSRSRAAITQELMERLAVPYAPFPDDRPVRRGTLMVRAPWVESDSADGSISSDAEEMCAYVRMLLNSGRSPKGRVLTEEGYRRLTTPVIASGEGASDEQYAYGLDVEQSPGRTLIGHTGGMVGYISAIRMDMEAGIGAVVLTNGATEVDDVARFALKAFAAANTGPEATPQETPYDMVVDSAKDYGGPYRSGSASFRVIADESNRLSLHQDGLSAILEPRGKDRFLVDLPEFAEFLLRFARENGVVTEAYFGSAVYAREGYGAQTPVARAHDHEVYCGHFRSSNPWLTNFRVLSRRGVLWMIQPEGEERELVALGQGLFRVGSDERSPERLRLFAVVNGKAQRADLSGQVYGRTSTM